MGNDGRYFQYTYDTVGNRLSQTICIGTLPCTPVTTTYTYDNANRLSTVNGQAYTWDNNGNLLNDGANEYAYDSANRLISVSNQSSVSSYQYNGLGDRVSQTVNGVTTNYTLDLNAGLTQVLSDRTNTYLYGNGRIGELQPSGFAYHLGDALGSVRQLADASGSVTLARSFEPYGETLTSAGSGATVWQFTGEARDAGTGLTFLRARYLSTQIGRFVSRDSWAGNFNSPITLNKYVYANANPTLYTDPSGRTPCFANDCPPWGFTYQLTITFPTFGGSQVYLEKVPCKSDEFRTPEPEIEKKLQTKTKRKDKLERLTPPMIPDLPTPLTIVELGAGDYNNAINKKTSQSTVYATNSKTEWRTGKRFDEVGKSPEEFPEVALYRGWMKAKILGVRVGELEAIENDEVPSDIGDLVYSILPYPKLAEQFGMDAARIAKTSSGTVIAVTEGGSGSSRSFEYGFNRVRAGSKFIEFEGAPYGKASEYWGGVELSVSITRYYIVP